VLVRRQCLHEAGAFLGDGGRWPGQQSRLLEHAVDAGRAASDGIGIEHHEGHSPVTFERVLAGEDADALPLCGSQPMIMRHPGVVLIDFAEALLPVVKLAGADVDPGYEPRQGDLGLVAPGAGEIDDQVAGVVGHPNAFQVSPRLFSH